MTNGSRLYHLNIKLYAWKLRSKVPLQGAELETYLTEQRAIKEREALQQASFVRTQRLLEADEGEESSDEEDGDGGSEAGDEVSVTHEGDSETAVELARTRMGAAGN